MKFPAKDIRKYCSTTFCSGYIKSYSKVIIIVILALIEGKKNIGKNFIIFGKIGFVK